MYSQCLSELLHWLQGGKAKTEVSTIGANQVIHKVVIKMWYCIVLLGIVILF